MHLLLAATLLMSTQDTARWAPLEHVIEDAIAARAFPGAVVAVGRRDTVLFLHAFGHLDYEHHQAVTPHTVYDIASLTKVVGLTTVLMMLVEQGRVGLDTPAVHYVPAFHDSAITVRQLLTHSSGLPAFKQWWSRVHAREEMFALANAEPLEQPPGTKMVYSDIGALILTEIAEQQTGQRLDHYLDHRLFRPLGMTETRYRPPRGWRARIAPTELDQVYRHQLVRGEVHDENAAAMGGISGHAGLFSTAGDLAKFAQMLLRGGMTPQEAHDQPGRWSGPDRLLNAETIEMFTRVQQPGFSSRALGWDTPSENSSAGSKLSSRAFGHTGFTGTSMWMDPEQDLFVILLTNRVYPTRENTRIFQVRRAVADAAVDIAGSR